MVIEEKNVSLILKNRLSGINKFMEQFLEVMIMKTENRKNDKKYHIYVSSELKKRVRYLSYLYDITQSQMIRNILTDNVDRMIAEKEAEIKNNE